MLFGKEILFSNQYYFTVKDSQFTLCFQCRLLSFRIYKVLYTQVLYKVLYTKCLIITNYVLTYLRSLGSNIDVLAINETKLDSSITNDHMQISGFDVVRRDRQLHGRNGGGVCMYVKSKQNFKIREDLYI